MLVFLTYVYHEARFRECKACLLYLCLRAERLFRSYTWLYTSMFNTETLCTFPRFIFVCYISFSVKKKKKFPPAALTI